MAPLIGGSLNLAFYSGNRLFFLEEAIRNDSLDRYFELSYEFDYMIVIGGILMLAAVLSIARSQN